MQASDRALANGARRARCFWAPSPRSAAPGEPSSVSQPACPGVSRQRACPQASHSPRPASPASHSLHSLGAPAALNSTGAPSRSVCAPLPVGKLTGSQASAARPRPPLPARPRRRAGASSVTIPQLEPASRSAAVGGKLGPGGAGLPFTWAPLRFPHAP